MKRRVIKQGHSTLTLTLPSKWVKRFGIKGGDEINVEEKENGIFLNTEKKEDSGILKTEIDIAGMDTPTLWKYFMAVYREGYDELKVNFSEEETFENPYKFFTSNVTGKKEEKGVERLSPLETIRQIANRFIGYEIIEQTRNSCTIKDVSQPSSKEFDSSLRRIFLIIEQMSEELAQAIEKDDPHALFYMHDMDISLDKLHDYCIRVLNRKEFKEEKKAHLIFATLYLLEMLGDEYKRISQHIITDMEGKPLKNLLSLAKMTKEQWDKFYELYYKFDKEKLRQLSDIDEKVYFYLPNRSKKETKKTLNLLQQELEIFNHFRRISRFINALGELRVEMEF